MECLHGVFLVVSRNEKEIKSKGSTEASGKYFEIGLTDGITVIQITAGAENPVVKCDMFKRYNMGFDYVDKKLKCTSVEALPGREPVKDK